MTMMKNKVHHVCMAISMIVLLMITTVATAQSIPAPKLDLIKRAAAAMKLDQRIHGLVRQQVESRVDAFRIDNPGAPDSLVATARTLIAGVYAENLEGRNGLMPRVYTVLDRHLTEEDLRFAVNFSGSDQGRR